MRMLAVVGVFVCCVGVNDPALADSNSTTTTGVSTSSTTSTVATTTTSYPFVRGNTVPVPRQPDALIRAGSNIWVASCSGDAITEVNAKTNQLVKELSKSTYGFDCPDALAYDGTNIWVANQLGNSLTVVNASSGDLARIVTGPQVLNPNALAFDGSNIWVSDNSQNGKIGSFISEFHAASGEFVRAITTPKNYRYFIGSPSCLALTSTSIWISDLLNDPAMEFNIHTGAYLRLTTGGPGTTSSCVTYHSGHIWLSGLAAGVISEYNATTGVEVREIFGVGSPAEIVFTGSDVFVISESPADSVKEFNSVGRFVRTVARSNKSLGRGIRAILVNGKYLWTANYSQNSVTKHRM